MSRPVFFSTILLLATTTASAAADSRPFFRLGLGWDTTADTTLADVDCTLTSPPALFGCGPGEDGRSLAARGDYGSTIAFEAGLGLEIGSRSRVELLVSSRPDVDLDAEANFLNVDAPQPVAAAGRSTALLVVGSFDLGPASWTVRPTVAAGLGAAYNDVDQIEYRFPTISDDSLTLGPGGSTWELAWTVGAGAAIALGPSSTLDVGVRWIDLGSITTDRGPALIRRPTVELVIDIAETEASLEAWGLAVSWRRRF